MSLLHFGWFLGAGFGVQGWGDPSYGIGYDWKQPQVYQDAARLFEASGFDLFIIEDGVAVPDTYGGTAEVNLADRAFRARNTTRCRWCRTCSAPPRNLGIVPDPQRELLRAVHRGAPARHPAAFRRTAGSASTSSPAARDLAAQNYGLDKQVEHDLRYDRADEWVDVVRQLWRSWDRDAIIEDAAARRLRRLHQGAHRSTTTAGSSGCADRSTPRRRARSR